ncbi:hypothetical protein DPX39_040077000 [Trypanosoma brucei equiperdum]|uniref:Uncharacterized protein n=1 Tax=Trypanosoma brucei equiperdum TaxID=630700 RepID=A0A3L6LBL6_9TRYP|nr:hypothetical protein DPX39_040077000 [Trypanosoma brucei equiperdum]
MPATSTWCQGPVPRIIGGSQQPAAFLSLGTLLCSGYGIRQHRDQQRLAGTPFFICRSLGTCQRAISSIIRTKMLLSGDVEENPGPSLRGMQWNCAGLSKGGGCGCAEPCAHTGPLSTNQIVVCEFPVVPDRSMLHFIGVALHCRFASQWFLRLSLRRVALFPPSS